MVGDTEFDIIGAHQTGMDGLGVSWGYGTRESMEEAGADGIADTMDELYRMIAEK
jgi:phosphoglycolate phosphatase